MATQWYWLEHAEERGPVSFRELALMIRDEQLGDDDLVREASWAEWQKADTVAGLYPTARRLRDESSEPHLECPPSHSSEVLLVTETSEESARYYSLEEVGHEVPRADFLRDRDLPAFQNDGAGTLGTSVADVINEATAAWDKRQGNYGAGRSRQSGGWLWALVASAVRLPWRFMLVLVTPLRAHTQSTVKRQSVANRKEATEAPLGPSIVSKGIEQTDSEDVDCPISLADDLLAEVLAEAEDLSANTEPFESTEAKEGLSELIGAATDAWDERHAQPAMATAPNARPNLVAEKSLGFLRRGLSIPGQIASVSAAIIGMLIGPFVPWISSNRKVAQTLTIAGLTGIFVWQVSSMFVTQRQVLTVLNQTFNELQELRSTEVAADEWDQFRNRSVSTLRSFVPKLESSADISDPASLSLLAVTRDYLPKLLSEESRSSAEMEMKIRRHLETAESTLTSGEPTVPSEFWTLLMLSLNLGLVGSAIWFFAKNLVFHEKRQDAVS
ncbi:MAG: DUF4339 domain-containing protein [Planctomycetaceae bacterium]